MKPLPNIKDEAAMILRGKRSAITSARNEAAQELRDASTYAQSAEWDALPAIADRAEQAARRLREVSGMWNQVNGQI